MHYTPRAVVTCTDGDGNPCRIAIPSGAARLGAAVKSVSLRFIAEGIFHPCGSVADFRFCQQDTHSFNNIRAPRPYIRCLHTVLLRRFVAKPRTLWVTM
jgi:hypothetical protein